VNRFAAAALLPLLWAAPAAAQQMDPNMPGMNMSAKPRPAAKHPAPKPAAKKAAPAHAGHDMSNMPGMAMPAARATTDPHAGHDMSAMPAMNMSAAAEPPIPQTPPPPPAKDHLADRYYDPAAMAASRHMMRMEMGDMRFAQVMANIAEYQFGRHGDGYRWDGQAWFGGDINRFMLRSEGGGSVKGGLQTGEVQALYSRAASPAFDLQAGVRQDFAPRGRTYVTVGAQGLIPYWFDLEGALFLSTKGELLARAEGFYDLRLTQRLVLQPRIELNFVAQNTPETRTGSGLSDAELGLRLRYEIKREFAPYIGVSYERLVGKTATYARAAGEDPEATTFVVGVRAWF
jgi:copper resistance protein B